jgi:hypothetical protein
MEKLPSALPRSMIFDSASQITDFIGKVYNQRGVAQSTLKNLLPIFPTPSLTLLANLQRTISPKQTEHALAELAEMEEGTVEEVQTEVFFVFVFKKFSAHLPPGLSSETLADFFTALYVFDSPSLKAVFKAMITQLLSSPHYYILAITASMTDPEEDNSLHHYIVAASLYMYDNKSGNYIAYMGVVEDGYPDRCTLSEKWFTDPTNTFRFTPV